MKQGGLADLSRAQSRLAAAVPGTAVANGAGDGDAAGVRASRRWTAIAESIAIGVLLPGVGLLVNREDPFFATRSFSWFVLPPLLAGLRHGFAAACASAAALGAAMLMGWRLHVFGGAELPGEALIGMFMVAMLTGHVSDVWLRETLRTRVTIDHARRRANEIARAHFLWQLSHERLQEQSPGVASLQDALERIGDIATGRTSLDWPAVAQQAVTMVGRFASVETASLIRTTPSGALGQVLAVLGEPRPVPPTDPMVLDAIQSREIASVAGPRANAAIGAGTRPGQNSRLLAAVPVVDSAGLLHGVLCVEALPFFAFTRQNIESLAVLMGRVGRPGVDGRQRRRSARRAPANVLGSPGSRARGLPSEEHAGGARGPGGGARQSPGADHGRHPVGHPGAQSRRSPHRRWDRGHPDLVLCCRAPARRTFGRRWLASRA